MWVGYHISLRWKLQGGTVSSHLLTKVQPIKSGTWIGFSSRCNVFMSCHMGYGVLLLDRFAQLNQAEVLLGLKEPAFQAFEFNANGVIIAIAAAPPA
jgi:hypothetical protein